MTKPLTFPASPSTAHGARMWQPDPYRQLSLLCHLPLREVARLPPVVKQGALAEVVDKRIGNRYGLTARVFASVFACDTDDQLVKPPLINSCRLNTITKTLSHLAKLSHSLVASIGLGYLKVVDDARPKA